MQTSKVAGAMALGLLIAGCGKKPEAPAETAAAAAAPAAAAAASADPAGDLIEACDVEFSSPAAEKLVTYWDPRGKRMLREGPSNVHSTYWADASQRKPLLDAKAPPLEVICGVPRGNGAEETSVGVVASVIGEADVPFGPGTYPIAARVDEHAKPPKAFYAWPIVYKGQSLFEATGGSVTITRFDDTGVAGSFEFEAKEQPVLGNRVIKVKATFEMPCRGGPAEAACKANKAIAD